MVARERIAKNAVVLPMLINPRSAATVVTRPSAFSGICSVGCT